MADLILIKHAQPVLDPAVAPREWQLAPEGQDQSRRLASRLRPFLPLELVCSPEPKAVRTCEIVAAELSLDHRIVDGFREIDRPRQAVVEAGEHERRNERLFREPGRAVVGAESADQALRRFSDAVSEALDTAQGSLAIVAHGTVISLFVAAHTDVDAFELWKRLRSPSFVVLSTPSFDLVDVVEGTG